MATDQTTRLEAATVKAENGSQIIYDVANGDASVMVQTASGPIPTLAGKLEEISDTLAISSGIYPTTAAALAATSNGQIFLVYAEDDDDIIYRVYKNQNGTAVDTGKNTISGTDLEQALTQASQSAAAAQQAAADAVESVKKVPVALASIAAVRAYNGEASFFNVFGAKGGLFYYDSSDTSSADDGVTVLIDTAGRRIKRQIEGKSLNAAWWGAVPDCTAQGVGTDVAPAIASAIAYAVSLGNGARVTLAPGSYRWASAQTFNLSGTRGLVVDLQGSIVTDATAMVCALFRNGYDLTINANFRTGGRFAGWAQAAPFYADYTAREVVSSGGQEAVKLDGVFGVTLNLKGFAYAGRLLRTTHRSDASFPNTGAIKGNVQTKRSLVLSEPRCAQAIYADDGSTVGTGNWGHLDTLVSDFDYWGPWWVELNDIHITYWDAAYAIGPTFAGTVVVLGDTWYIGAIDASGNGGHHIRFKASDGGRKWSGVNVGKMVFLDKQNGLLLADGSTDRENFNCPVISVIASTSNAYNSGIVVNNCPKVRANIYATGQGSNLGYIAGALSDDIELGLYGENITSNAFFINAEIPATAKIRLHGKIKGVPGGFSCLLINTQAMVRVEMDLESEAGSLMTIGNATNKVYWIGGSIKGAAGTYGNTNRPLVVRDVNGLA